MYEQNETPRFELSPRTVVFDPEHNREVAYFDGQVILPVGTVIQLADLEHGPKGNVDATVKGIRVLQGPGERQEDLYLDVDLPESWWDMHPWV